MKEVPGVGEGMGGQYGRQCTGRKAGGNRAIHQQFDASLAAICGSAGSR